MEEIFKCLEDEEAKKIVANCMNSFIEVTDLLDLLNVLKQMNEDAIAERIDYIRGLRKLETAKKELTDKMMNELQNITENLRVASEVDMQHIQYLPQNAPKCRLLAYALEKYCQEHYGYKPARKQ